MTKNEAINTATVQEFEFEAGYPTADLTPRRHQKLESSARYLPIPIATLRGRILSPSRPPRPFRPWVLLPLTTLVLLK